MAISIPKVCSSLNFTVTLIFVSFNLTNLSSYEIACLTAAKRARVPEPAIKSLFISEGFLVILEVVEKQQLV
ncbi:MAG: hypothetical protein OCU20_08415, partial [Methanophagales archaeon]|nr:hypothetical protein [Methanophagales archaeon]